MAQAKRKKIVISSPLLDKYMAQAKQQKQAGVAYKDFIKTKDKAAEIVDVTVPSGFVFKFEKPSKFSMLFQAGQLPLAATNKAVGAWKEDGLIDEEGSAVNEDQSALVKMAVATADKVLKFSRVPKLVVGTAIDDNELSIDDVNPTDLEYLFHWVAAGGEVSAMLGTFPGRSQPDALASASRKGKRFPTEHVSGDQG